MSNTRTVTLTNDEALLIVNALGCAFNTVSTMAGAVEARERIEAIRNKVADAR